MNWNMHWLTTALDGLLAFTPSLIAGLLVLAVGYIVAKVLARATRSLAHRLGLDALMTNIGIIDRGTEDASRIGSLAVYWTVLVATFLQTARIWGLTFVADGLASVVAYLPHVLGAAVIFTLALYLGNFVRDRLVQRPPPGLSIDVQHGLVPGGVRAGIIALGAFMAVRELHIAEEIVTVAFTFVLGAIALAVALAFGLGSRDVAGRVTQSWYEKRANGLNGRTAAPPVVERAPDDRPRAP